MNDIQGIPTRYVINLLIGEGGLGKVYQAFDKVTQRKIALKIIKDTYQGTHESLKNEFKLLSQLRYPYLVQVYDFGILPTGTPYFTMEFIDGEDLATFLSAKLEKSHILNIIKQTLSALNFLHDKDILHGDIKPNNIMIVQKENDPITCKLLDFGLSRPFISPSTTISGTPHYLAPEIIIGGTYSKSSDLYALGLSIIESITSIICGPINLKNTSHKNIQQSLVDTLNNLHFHNPTSLTNFLMSLLQTNPCNRPKSSKSALDFFSMLIEQKSNKRKEIFRTIFINREKVLKKLKSIINQARKDNNFIMLKGIQGVGKKCIIKDIIRYSQLNGYLIIDLKDKQYNENTLNKFVDLFSQNIANDLGKKLLDSHNSLVTSIVENEYDNKFIFPQNKTPFIYSNIIQFIHEFSKNRPILISIPDIERFSNDFLFFIKHLISVINNRYSNILIISSRNKDLDIYPDKKPIIKDFLVSIPIDETFNIREFNEKEVTILLYKYFGKNIFSNEEINYLLLQTKGIPLFINQLINHFISEKIIQYENHTWHLDRIALRNFSIPNSIEELIFSILNNLTDVEKNILYSIAFWGLKINRQTLRKISHSSLEDINHLINKLLTLNILTEIEPGLIEIINPLYSKILRKITPSKIKTNINNSIANLLMKKEIEENKYRIAQHLIEAKNTDLAIDYGLSAAEQILKRFEIFECISLLNKLKELSFASNKKPQIVRVLNKIAPLESMAGLSKESIKDYDLLLKYSSKDTDKAKYLKQIAKIYDQILGQEKKANDIYRKALYHARNANDTLLEAMILIELGYADNERGHELLIQASSLTKDIDINLYARSLSKLTYHYLLSGNAIKLNETIKKITPLLSDVNFTTKKEILSNLYTTYFYQGNYKKAEKLIKEKILIEEETNDEINKIRSLTSLGGCYYVQGEFSSTINILIEALILARKYNVHVMSINILSNLSLSYLSLANYGEAINTIDQSEELIEKYKITEIGTYYLIKPTKLYLYLGKEYEKIYKYFLRETLKKAKISKNIITLAHGHLCISRYYYQKLKITPAVEKAQEALNQFKEAADKDDIVETLAQLSIYMVEINNSNDALNYSNKALQIYNDIHCDYLKPLLLFSRGATFRILAREEANDILISALSISQRMGMSEISWQVQRELALLNIDQGYINKGIEFYEDSIITLRSITESMHTDSQKLSYLSVPLRNRIFTEIKDLVH